MFGLGVNRLGTTNQKPFSPASLFNNGEAGVWYDPSAASGSLDWRKNLLEYTESFDNSYWNKGLNSTLTPNYGAAPDGNQTAYRLQMPASGGTYFRADNVSVVVGKKYTFSIYAKSVSGTSDFDMFNQVSGTYVQSGTKTATSEWQRFSFTTSAAVATASRGFGINNFDDSYATDILIWGWQVEEASTASSYQPILSTFANSFKAAFPSHTLYQDYQGVTPVTAVGEPVGLMLDKSKGLAQGPEEITNGDFSNGLTGWVTSGDVSIVSGSAHLTNTSTYGAQAFQGVSGLTVGKFYKLTLDTEAISGPDSSWYIDDFLGVYVQGVTSSQGRHSYTLQATATSFTLQFKKFGIGVVSLDNVSVTEIQGSHATQPTSTKRPIYARHPEGGIRNLLNYTEQFDNPAWAKTGVTVTPNTTIAPDGTQTADTAVFANTYGSSIIRDYVATLASTYTFSFYAKASSAIQIGARVGSANTSFTLSTEWQRFTLSASVTADANTIVEIRGGVVSGVTAQIWGAQLEEATEASNYQKRVTDIDVTESGVGEVYYLKFDGTDDGMFINNLSSGNTPLTALFGYSATNVDGRAKFLVDIESGRTIFAASANTAGYVGYYSGGWSEFSADAAAIKVLTYDLAEDDAKIRIDGTQEYSDTTYDQRAIGGDIALFGRYDETGLHYLAGNMYQTILRAAESTDEEIAKAETYVANKTGLKAQVDGIATLDLNFGANLYTAKNSNGGVI